jgi:hypothetical protein
VIAQVPPHTKLVNKRVRGDSGSFARLNGTSIAFLESETVCPSAINVEGFGYGGGFRK